MRARTAVLTILVTAIAVPAAAQSWPAKPIRFISLFAPGGGADIQSEKMGESDTRREDHGRVTRG